MTEKGIIVGDALSGESVACRDGYETDDDTNARVVQLFDLSQRQHGFTINGSVGRIRWIIENDSSDTTDLYPVPSDILTNALLCGDKTTLVASILYAVQDVAEIITITPIVIGADNAAIGILCPRIFQGFKPAGGSAITRTFNVGAEPMNLTEITSWNVLGAYKVGLHVAVNSPDGLFSSTVAVYAKMITGPSFDVPIATRPTAGAYTSEVHTPGGEGE